MIKKLVYAAVMVTAFGLAFGLVTLSNPAPVAVAEAQAQPDASRDSVALAIYNQGTALVQDRRTFDFTAGVNTLNFTDVAAGIDATSVTFVSLSDPLGTVVLEQNYVFDLVNSAALLARYLDETIEVVAADATQFSGQLLSGRNNEIILRQDDGQVLVIGLDSVRDLRFPDLPGGLITRPTLRWLVQSANEGPQQVELTYLTNGINWAADYNVLLNEDNSALDINGWVTLTNRSGAAYVDAQVKLVAGDVNRLPDPEVMRDMAFEELAMAAPVPTQAVQQREIFEYNLYEITRPVTVAANETKQVEFVSGAEVPAHTFYVYASSVPFYGGLYTDQFYGQTGITDVQTYLEFSTGEEGGLGADLPAGRIRVYQEDIDSAALLIGENRIDHTPEGEEVEIFLGNAFDLVGERTQTNFELVAANVLEETYEIRLRNRKDDEAVEIRVPENLFRWSNWEILDSTHDFAQLTANQIEFRVDVPPQGETVITYTVRYTWPR
ncbi:MAG: DUF4139 domain-containing protein [Chloroflexi bacterium]|nr:DUF4139 domain-containing protein [Chloroflexota bacterium]